MRLFLHRSRRSKSRVHLVSQTAGVVGTGTATDPETTGALRWTERTAGRLDQTTAKPLERPVWEPAEGPAEEMTEGPTEVLAELLDEGPTE